MIEKNNSTWFSHDACVGVLCKNTLLVLVEELLDLGCRVRGEVVDDAMQFETLGRVGDEVVEELDEVVRAGAVGHPAGDVAFVDVEARRTTRRCRAVV